MTSNPPAPRERLMPMHAVLADGETGRVLQGRRKGGKPKLARAVDFDELAYIDAINRAREQHVARDPLVVATSPADVLHHALLGLVEEAASLKWEIQRGHQDGNGGVERISSRRIDALTKATAVIFGRVKLFEPQVSTAQVSRVRDLFIDAVRQVADATLPTDVASNVIGRLTAALEAQSIEVAP